ncbi:S9 family peptidase [Bacteroidales bacterium OttesenSCG-928-K03]|nr:S9 family peptidase [Odoribacter sp. OttesenSCG-928-L07]MDL2239225.1 S9 family peptidase [Bacteroidales bacterium OttesenSCG-928-L14]MDL2240061.1 S9 family peptidase [Bacteroidales bacterium OttesenSCG-928-K22]MDL2242336.1 S9 family peptidase [Bacteroidales bacterium OttesenSCG-928-K03]
MNKKSILIILCFIPILLLGQKQLTLEDFFQDYTFRPKSVYGINSMNDGKHYTTLEKGEYIVKHSYATGKIIDTLYNISMSQIEGLYIQSYEFSKDEKKILIMTDMESIYRRSFTADYYVADLTNNTIKQLSENGRQQLGTFSPDGKKIAFVRENNLFIVDSETFVETQITFDGQFNHIINGAPDWVYEEEFGFNKAFDWSPDSKKIAYMRFDESNVKMFNMTMFRGSIPAYEEYALYPHNSTFKYPKAGEDNSIVEVYIYDVASNQKVKVDVGEETDQYIPRIRWTNNKNKLSVFRVNRLQNKFEILFADATTGKSDVVYTEENKYYISESVYDQVDFIDDENIILTSECNGYMHIYKYNLKTKVLQQITAGEWDIEEYIGYDAASKTVYYTSYEGTPIRSNLYSIRIDGKKRSRLTKGDGTNYPIFSTGFKYFINYFSNSTTPYYITLHEASGKLIRVLEDNKEYLAKVGEYKYNTKEFFKFTTTNGDELNGYMIKPVNFDERKQYPVLMTQYSGPGSRSAVDSWSFDWYNYLSQEGYLIVCVDPRGTGGRGEEFKKCTYLQLGKYESDDQIEAAKYLTTLSYVDEDNISIWGWSYGGFMVALCLEKGDGIFKAGVSIAPVTNWRYYDNIYTERFMRTPQENPSGYDDNSPITHAKDLQGHLLLIHGTADDNVHVQNAVEYAEMLVQANKQFDYMLYTNRNHGIRGGNTSLHLFTKVVNFLNEKLK